MYHQELPHDFCKCNKGQIKHVNQLFFKSLLIQILHNLLLCFPQVQFLVRQQERLQCYWRYYHTSWASPSHQTAQGLTQAAYSNYQWSWNWTQCQGSSWTPLHSIVRTNHHQVSFQNKRSNQETFIEWKLYSLTRWNSIGGQNYSKINPVNSVY